MFDKDLPIHKATIGYILDWYSEEIPEGWKIISDLDNYKLIQKVR